jgi:hypothetical protein
VLARAEPGLRFNEHLDEEDGPLVFHHACKQALLRVLWSTGWRRSADSKGSLKMRKFTLVGITATMASLFALTNTATSRTTASADPEGLSSMPSSILSFLLDTLIALF